MRTFLTGIALATAAVVAVPVTAASAASTHPSPAASVTPPAAAAVTTAAAAPAARASDVGVRAGTSLRGWGRLALRGPAPDPDGAITLGVDAHSVARPGEVRPTPAMSWGHVTVRHAFRENGRWTGTVRAEIRVDCLVRQGEDAVLTGTADSVTYTVPPGAEQPHFPAGWHPEVALGFHRDAEGRSRVAWTGVPDSRDAPPVATRCEAPSVDSPDLYLIAGGFDLK
ncbi:hypothetical protein [Streptomyces sp. NRRL S-87]|uniref:hypothetical protein n=1 Tax=Streptomyces sp. NRRL S-87 TaxID=1463920 RepID=UPI0004C04C03|nr:hypothetical protein [Streptomyces sp. NRRL S-87]